MGYFCCKSYFAYAKILLMNEGENTGMSNGPIFSSPNIAGSQPQPQQTPVPMPEQPTDITKIGNPALTTTVAAMPEQDGPAKPAVMSGGDPIDKKKPRFGFTSRRFKDRTQAPAAPVMQAVDTPAFANAPEFFNNAVGDIVTADAAAAEKQSKTKKALIIGIVAVVVTIAVIGAVFGISAISNSVKASAAQKDWTRFANYVLYGEEKDDALPEKSSEIGPEAKARIVAVFKKKGSFYKEKEAVFTEKYAKAKEKILAKNKNISFEELDKLTKTLFDLAKMETGVLYYPTLTARNDLSALRTQLEKKRDEHVELDSYGYYLDMYREAIDIAMLYRSAGCLSGKTLNNICTQRILDNNAEEAGEVSLYQGAYDEAINEEAESIIKELIRINNKAK